MFWLESCQEGFVSEVGEYQILRIDPFFAFTFKEGLNHFSENASPLSGKYLVYAGQEQDFSDGMKALPFDRVEEVFA
ncbi:hypothetical protein VDG1235_2716 [Verrucomicrobiia bacterium DG1235]|nr:hypothetical protein VDG1235_2716 [Verrucomicrobiae bacterium DG1235]